MNDNNTKIMLICFIVISILLGVIAYQVKRTQDEILEVQVMLGKTF